MTNAVDFGGGFRGSETSSVDSSPIPGFTPRDKISYGEFAPPLHQQVFEVSETVISKHGGMNSEHAGLVAMARELLAGVKSHALDTSIFQDGRDANNASRIDGMESMFQQHMEDSEIREIIIEAEAYVDALPSLVDGEALIGRHDATMALGFATTVELPKVIDRLARRSDALGAIVTDERWLSDYLSTRSDISDDTRNALVGLMKNVVVEAARVSGDAKRVAATRKIDRIKDLRACRVAAASATRYAISEARKVKAPRLDQYGRRIDINPPVPSPPPNPNAPSLRTPTP